MEKDLYQEMFDLEMKHWWFRARRRIISSVIDSRLNAGDSPRFLDIGCGTGAMLKELESMGKVVGLDVSEDALSFAASRTGARLIKGEVPGDLYDIDEKFDLVLMLDLLEHVDNDLDVLSAASTLLRDNGMILITVPAFQWLYAPRDVYHHHRRRYSKKDLESLAQDSGLKTIILSYYNFFLFPIAAASRMASRIRGDFPAPDIKLPASPLNRALEAVFGAERFLLQRFSLPWGLSLIYLGRRSEVRYSRTIRG